ncbi:MAG: CDP-alcohol phosphatidyltransferase family protein [Labilithrix sp.]|nr:CDP-alcohol phosphatidyltransferase family protein [Labilithrix sp.]
MLGKAREVYVATRKKHDLLFNVYMMRPIAAAVVAILAKTKITPNQITILNLAIFVVAAVLLAALPTYEGGLVAVAVLEVSYCFDCVDGMLARFKKIASKEGHLFDFFTDELKAVLLVAFLAIRLFRTGGFGIDLQTWPSGHVGFLYAGIAGTVILASATSLTNFVRRPEVSGRASTVEAHYETVQHDKPKSIVGLVAHLVTSFLRFLNHYPSHIWIFALAGRFDVLFWIYASINLLYLARGWLGIILRFGR